MIRFVVSLALILAPWPVLADCTGQNLITALPPKARAALEAEANAAPFAKGNLWHATKGAQLITLVGTFHLADPRHEAILAALQPDLATAKALLVEAGPEQEAALKADIALHPDLLIHDGPTLPEALSPQDWTRLSDALNARDIPPFVVAKLQPWYVASLLAIPACQFTKMATTEGLDKRLIAAAQARNLPLIALEPYDTLFRIFDAIPDTDQTDMLLETLSTAGAMENNTAQTLSDSYIAGESRLFWEFSRHQIKMLGADPAKVDHLFELVETNLLTNRNRTWLPVIEAEAAKGPIIVAFGALHLSGDTGILNLLSQNGWTVTP